MGSCSHTGLPAAAQLQQNGVDEVATQEGSQMSITLDKICPLYSVIFVLVLKIVLP